MKRIIQLGGGVSICLLLLMMQSVVAQNYHNYNQRSSNSSYQPSSSYYSYTPMPEYSDAEYRAKINDIYSPRIKLTYNRRIRAFIHVYTKKKRAVAERILGMQQVYFPIIEPIFQQHGMPNTLKYLAATESALNQNAVSKAGATGLWQFMKATGKEHHLRINSTVDERRDPYKATVAAARFLKRLHRKYGDWLLAIAAYNCGAGNVNKAIRKSGGRRTFWGVMRHLPRETRGYVPSFIACVYFMNYPSDHYLDAITPVYPDEYRYAETVRVNQVMSFNTIARRTGVSVDRLKYLNAALRKNKTPNHAYSLRLPAHAVTAFKTGSGGNYSSLAYNSSNSRSYYSSSKGYQNTYSQPAISQSYTLPNRSQSSVYQGVRNVMTSSSASGKIKPIPPISTYYKQVRGSSAPIKSVAYTPTKRTRPAPLKPIPPISSYRNQVSSYQSRSSQSTATKSYGISDAYSVDSRGNKKYESRSATISSSSPYTINQSPSYSSNYTTSSSNTTSKPMVYTGNISSSTPLTSSSPYANRSTSPMVYTGNISSTSYPTTYQSTSSYPSSYNTSGNSGRVMMSYTVKEGDNLSRIADWYNCSVDDIKTWNSVGNVVNPGQPLNIWVPASQEGQYNRIDKLSLNAKQAIYGSQTTVAKRKSKPKAKKSTRRGSTKSKKSSKVKKHKVRKGETLWSIAQRYQGTTLASLRKLNGLKRSSKIRPGELLKIHVR